MRRRDAITAIAASTVAWVLAARAQKPATPVIGLLGGAIPDDAEVARNLAAFRLGLADAGFVEGPKRSALNIVRPMGTTSAYPRWPKNW